jgi:integrase/recombinase XerD
VLQRRTPHFSLDDALDLFLLDGASRRLAQSTLKFYESKVSLFIRWCNEADVTDLNALTAHDIRRFLVHIYQRGLSSQYQNNLARAIRAFLNYCVRDELIETSPFDKVRMPKVEKKILEAMTEREITIILQSCKYERDKAICLFLLDSGVRAGELVALKMEDVDMRTGVVAVHAGKGQKGRTTYIGAKTRKQLKRYLAQRGRAKPDAPLFVNLHTGKALTVWGMTQLMERLRERSGVQNCVCHTFRRTFALTCLRNGMNIYVLARLMGHADISVLRPYLALVEDDLEDAHAKYGAVDTFLR